MGRKAVRLKFTQDGRAHAAGGVHARFAVLNEMDDDGDILRPGVLGEQHVPLKAWCRDRGVLVVGSGTIREAAGVVVFDGRFFSNATVGQDSYRIPKQLGDSQPSSYAFHIEQSRLRKPHAGAFPMRSDGMVRELIKLTVHEVSLFIAGPAPTDGGAADPRFIHTEGYESVQLGGVDFALTRPQAQVVRNLHEAHAEGFGSLSTREALEEIETCATKVSEVFRRSPAWGTLVVRAGRGRYRLNLPRNAPQIPPKIRRQSLALPCGSCSDRVMATNLSGGPLPEVLARAERLVGGATGEEGLRTSSSQRDAQE